MHFGHFAESVDEVQDRDGEAVDYDGEEDEPVYHFLRQFST